MQKKVTKRSSKAKEKKDTKNKSNTRGKTIKEDVNNSGEVPTEASTRKSEIAGVLFVAFGLISLCGLAGLNVGYIGKYVAQFLKYGFGIGSAVVSLLFLVVGGYHIMQHRRVGFSKTSVGVVLLLISLLGLYHHMVIPIGSEILPTSLADGGGLVGGLLTFLLHKPLGNAGTTIIFMAAIIGSILLATPWSLAQGILTTKAVSEKGADVAMDMAEVVYDNAKAVGSKVGNRVQNHVEEQVQKCKSRNSFYDQAQDDSFTNEANPMNNNGNQEYFDQNTTASSGSGGDIEPIIEVNKRDNMPEWQAPSPRSNQQPFDGPDFGLDEGHIPVNNGSGSIASLNNASDPYAFVNNGSAAYGALNNGPDYQSQSTSGYGLYESVFDGPQLNTANTAAASPAAEEEYISEYAHRAAGKLDNNLKNLDTSGFKNVRVNKIGPRTFDNWRLKGKFAADLDDEEAEPPQAVEAPESEEDLDFLMEQQEDNEAIRELEEAEGEDSILDTSRPMIVASIDDLLYSDNDADDMADHENDALADNEADDVAVHEKEADGAADSFTFPASVFTDEAVPSETVDTVEAANELDIPEEVFDGPEAGSEAPGQPFDMSAAAAEPPVNGNEALVEAVDASADSVDRDFKIDFSADHKGESSFTQSLPEEEGPAEALGEAAAALETAKAAGAAAAAGLVEELAQEARLSNQAQEEEQEEQEELPPYEVPDVRDVLKEVVKEKDDKLEAEIQSKAKVLAQTLKDFKVNATILGATHGPAVTRYEVKLAPGVKVNKLTGLADDIALSMAATSVRIEQIPNRSTIGIEVPNRKLESVPLREVLENPAFDEAKSKLTVGFGKDISGKAIFGNLADMPHLLVAGATGSGKSVCINTIVTSILFKAKPDEVKFIMIDPKMVELSIYNDIPHLMVPVVTDARKAASVLNWAVQEMEKRYGLIAQAGVKNIETYNKYYAEEKDKQMSSVVIIIDELADLMMVAPHDVEDAICRLAQKARAAGIYLVLATQRPSVNVITGVIKANIPSRISFAVTSQIDSRTILDSAGAEKLLGKGDMLFKPQTEPKAARVQGAFVSDADVELLVERIKQQGHKLEINQEIIDFTNKAEQEAEGGEEDNGKTKSSVDELLRQAVELVMQTGNASASSFQRRYHIGFTRAGRLLDTMEQLKIVGPPQGSKPREILVTEDQAFEIMDKLEEHLKEEK